jgi:butyrate kinase
LFIPFLHLVTSKPISNMENLLILTIKPESLATKIGVYQNTDLVFLKSIKHCLPQLEQFSEITDQYRFRSQLILDELNNADIDTSLIKAVVARGGLLKPIKSGIYEVNQKMEHDLRNSPVGKHAVNLGGLIANEIIKNITGARAFIADPVVVDELCDLARFSGLPELERKSVFHALHHKAVARKHAKAQLKRYEDLNLIIAHLGDGISIGAHCKGKVIDVNQAYDGEGPFTLETAGTLPVGDLIKLCFNGKYTLEEMMSKIRDKGGVFAYLHSNTFFELDKALREDDAPVKKVFEAMAFQVSKYIGAMSTVLKGDVDAIILTGNMANNKWFVNLILERVNKIAPVHIYPGEDILEALNMNGLMAMKGEAEILVYE